MKWKLFCPLLGWCFAGILSSFAANLTNQQNTIQPLAISRVGVEEFAALLSKQDTVILDVRTPREYQAGHIKGAINLDFHGSEFDASLSRLDKSRTYLVYCAGGGRSALACKKMSLLSFPKLVDLAPGFMGWRQAGKPMEK